MPKNLRRPKGKKGEIENDAKDTPIAIALSSTSDRRFDDLCAFGAE